MANVTTLKAHRKASISAHFIKISEKIWATSDFWHLLRLYETQLIAETEYLDIKYCHPLRAAEALERVVTLQSEDNFDTFHQVATDSKFNPQARAIAWGLLNSLVFTAIVALLVLAVVSGAPAAIILFGVGLASALSGMISIPIGVQAGNIKLESYAPVTQAVATGKEVHAGFFPPPAVLAIPEQKASASALALAQGL